jgi:ribosomal protein S9
MENKITKTTKSTRSSSSTVHSGGEKKYFRALGRRKTATAVVRLIKSTKNSYTINGKDFTVYFQHLN